MIIIRTTLEAALASQATPGFDDPLNPGKQSVDKCSGSHGSEKDGWLSLPMVTFSRPLPEQPCEQLCGSMGAQARGEAVDEHIDQVREGVGVVGQASDLVHMGEALDG